MNKSQKSWNTEDINYLKENYGIISTKEIAEKLDRSYTSTKAMAIKRLKLKYGSTCKNLLKPILEDTIQNWYWYGFITGDGNFSKDALRINVSKIDASHLKKFASIFNSNLQVSNNYTSVSIGDKNNYNILKDKLGIISEQKTITPVILPKTTNILFFCYFIGLVDSDGCIYIQNNKARELKIALYHTWYDNLLEISKYLKEYLNINSKVIIDKRGYALFRIIGHKNILKIKNKSNELNIEYLNRKWVNISNNITGCNFYSELRHDIIKLYQEGNNLHKISKILNVNYSSLFNHKNDIING